MGAPRSCLCCLSLSVVLAQCPFFEQSACKVVYRRYSSLYFLIGIPLDEVTLAMCVSVCLCLCLRVNARRTTQNEFIALDVIRTLVETLNVVFKNVVCAWLQTHSTKYIDHTHKNALLPKSELDLLYGVDRVHMVVDALLAEGTVMETSQEKLATPAAIVAAT